MPAFDPACRRCPRLAGFLDDIRGRYPDYHAAPVPAFGARQPQLLIVGLAPGMHGANRSGRPFTGDYAGVLLYQTLHKFGFASRPESVSADDGLELHNCRITNAVKCLPPENKPTNSEIIACNDFLSTELNALESGAVILALGGIAHKAILRAQNLKQAAYPFGHAVEYTLDRQLTLLSSYHCSRYNTQTGRLTTEMFEAVMARAKAIIADGR
ncbi:MAG: uracil-DNA glycosylase [Salinisphaeraceae bacterium]|nr:uracil-DNA glycosylase [Salinisphaeraceae bacterium]